MQIEVPGQQHKSWARAVNTNTNWGDKVDMYKVRPGIGNKVVGQGQETQIRGQDW